VANGIVPNQGLTRALYRILVNEDTLMTPWQMLLFVNDVTPDEDTVEADLVEADFAGYARITPAWDTIIPDAFGRATSLDALHTFTCTGGGVTNSIYGIYFYDDTASLLQFVYRFPAPISMALAGDTIPFRGKLLDGNLAPP